MVPESRHSLAVDQKYDVGSSMHPETHHVGGKRSFDQNHDWATRMNVNSINHWKKNPAVGKSYYRSRSKPNTTHSVPQLAQIPSPGAYCALSTLLVQIGELPSSDQRKAESTPQPHQAQ